MISPLIELKLLSNLQLSNFFFIIYLHAEYLGDKCFKILTVFKVGCQTTSVNSDIVF
jgi:hypothetical protein